MSFVTKRLRATLLCTLTAACSAPVPAPDAGDAMSRTQDAAMASFDCRVAGDGKTTLVFVNHCTRPVSFRGSAMVTGELAPGEHACRDVGSSTTTLSALRYWGFIGEDPGGEHHTLAEFTFNTDFQHFDWYDISHVDAFNLPMQIVPVAMPRCPTRTCAQDLLPNCPAAGQFRGTGNTVISCVSPDRNNANSTVARYFETGCADAYSWSGDDAATTACAGEDYDVVFCP